MKKNSKGLSRFFGLALSGLVVFSASLCAADAGETAPVSATAQAAHRVISTGDLLAIDVFNEKNLTGQYRVNETGKIIFPMIGEAQAAGLSMESFRVALTEGLKKFIKDPLVRIDHVEEAINSNGSQAADANTVIVLGQVKSQGLQALNPEGSTLLQAIAQAGGFGVSANPRAVKVVSYATGTRQTKVYNLFDVLEGRAEDPAISRGDSIYVPESLF